jgi:hypothetical protein
MRAGIASNRLSRFGNKRRRDAIFSRQAQNGELLRISADHDEEA